MRDLHSAFLCLFPSIRSGGTNGRRPKGIRNRRLRGNNVRWPKGIENRRLRGKSKAKSKAIVIRKNTLFYANRFILIALQMLIFNAGGLQLAFPLAADRWFPPN